MTCKSNHLFFRLFFGAHVIFRNFFFRESKCCGVLHPLDFNVSWWQTSIYESLDSADKQESAFKPKEDVLLPWSCCVPHNVGMFVPQPEAMANTIRQRLKEKGEEAAEAEAAEEQLEKENELLEKHGSEGVPDKPKTFHAYSPEVMIEEGPVIEPHTWCR